VTRHLFIFTHRPSLRSTDPPFFYFSSCKQLLLGSIFTFLLPNLSGHKELISCRTGMQWKGSQGKMTLNGGKAERENALRRKTTAGGGRKRKCPAEKDHSRGSPGRCARGYSAGKTPELGENLDLNPSSVPSHTACGGSFIIHLDSTGPVTQAAFTVTSPVPSPLQTETGRLAQSLCKRWERDSAKSLLFLRCHQVRAGACCGGKPCHPRMSFLCRGTDKALSSPRATDLFSGWL